VVPTEAFNGNAHSGVGLEKAYIALITGSGPESGGGDSESSRLALPSGSAALVKKKGPLVRKRVKARLILKYDDRVIGTERNLGGKAQEAFGQDEPGWRIIMKKIMLIAGAAMIGVGFLTAHANAQGVPQTVEITKVDVQKVAAVFRASKFIGSSVLNDANETIGKIDDLLVTRDGKEPYAVLSIGGFLGMGTHLVVVRYDSLKFADNKIVLPGGTKDGLKMLPAFQYAKE